MSERPSFEAIYLQLAFLLAERSTCKRLRVGTVITTTDFRKVLAVGYNGNASGFPNTCDREEVGNCGCIHSEDNAVTNCDAPRATGKFVFVTNQPCELCAKRFVNLGNVERVYYCLPYRLPRGLDVLRQAGITVVQLPPPASLGQRTG